MLVLFILGISAAFVLLISFGAGTISIINLFTKEGEPAGGMIGSFAFGFEFVILILCSWFVLEKTMGREQADHRIKFPFAAWQIIVVIGVVTISIIIGGVAAFTEIAWLNWLVLPLLTLLVIVPPLWILTGIGTTGIDLGPRWRVFGIIGLGMTIGPLIMIVLEISLLLVIIIFGVAVIAIQQPELFQELLSLSQMLRAESDPDRILSLVAPYLASPALIATLIGYIAVLVPMLEELLKPLAVWIFARKIESPAQGFAMGVFSGAAFALLESLNASGDGSTSWPVIVSIRAGTSLLHMALSGLVGWGIASAFREKRIGRFFSAYFAAVTIHGIWNACAVGAGFSMVGEFVGKPEWFFNIVPAAVCGMSVLGIGMLALLIAGNRKLRNTAATPIEEKNNEEVKSTL